MLISRTYRRIHAQEAVQSAADFRKLLRSMHTYLRMTAAAHAERHNTSRVSECMLLAAKRYQSFAAVH